MKIKFWTWVEKGGDGFYGVRFFNTREAAEAAQRTELEQYGEGFTDSVEVHVLEVETEGRLVL